MRVLEGQVPVRSDLRADPLPGLRSNDVIRHRRLAEEEAHRQGVDSVAGADVVLDLHTLEAQPSRSENSA